jgi:hypothetical protein
MKFVLKIESGNDAFYRQPEGDASDGTIDEQLVGELVRQVAAQVKDGFTSGSVRDPINGQSVGSFTLTDD